MPVDSRVTLHKLEVFELVVEHGSVSRAAEQLYVSQPVVSEHLRSLERRVGAPLFYREARALRLTESGEAVHGWATDLLTRTRSLSRQIDGLSDGMRGSAVIAASMSVGSYLLPRVLAGFRRDRPATELGSTSALRRSSRRSAATTTSRSSRSTPSPTTRSSPASCWATSRSWSSRPRGIPRQRARWRTPSWPTSRSSSRRRGCCGARWWTGSSPTWGCTSARW